MAVLTATGCGPSLYAVNVSSATRRVEQAREARAAELAPYEFHYAEQNLAKAREEAAESSYEDAIECAQRAERFGSRALELARSADGSAAGRD